MNIDTRIYCELTGYCLIVWDKQVTDGTAPDFISNIIDL